MFKVVTAQYDNVDWETIDRQEADEKEMEPQDDYFNRWLSETNEATWPVVISRACVENKWDCETVPGNDELWILMPQGSRLRDALFISGTKNVLRKLYDMGWYLGG